MSASWGEDDIWDVAARYAGEWNGIKVAAAAAYNEVTDSNYNNVCTAFGSRLQQPARLHSGRFLGNYFQAGAYVEHVPTGIFGLVNYGHLEADDDGSCRHHNPAGLRHLSPAGQRILVLQGWSA